MKIIGVDFKLQQNPDRDRVLAFVSIILRGGFVIKDLKLIEGPRGVFVAMPSRKIQDRCPRCGLKNNMQACYCNHCGFELAKNRAVKNPDGSCKLHMDVAHPIDQGCRLYIHEIILAAYERELKLASQPGYVSRYDSTHEPAERA